VCDPDVGLRIMRLQADRDSLRRVAASLVAYQAVVAHLGATRRCLAPMDRALLDVLRRSVANDVALTASTLRVVHAELEAAAVVATNDALTEDERVAVAQWPSTLAVPLQLLADCAASLEPLVPGAGPGL
jgi:hypothetical protein